MSETAPLFSDEEIDQINSTQRLLRDIAERATREGWRRGDEESTLASTDAMSCGRVHSMADVAADALFQFLNVSNANGVRRMSHEQLHARTDPVEID
jgi:hypothetical protein